jgi:hypothetical protein
MRFDHSESDLLAADWTGVMDDVLNPHVTPLPPDIRVKVMAAQTALIKRWN